MATVSRLPATIQPAEQAPRLDPLHQATAAFLIRYKPVTRRIYQQCLRRYVAWCRLNGLDPMSVTRPHIEGFARQLEMDDYARTTRAKTISAVCLFYKFAHMDGYLSVDPSINVARPKWPQDSPTLGLTHLQFEAMLHAGSESENPYDFAMVAMLGLLGLRLSEACNAQIEDLGVEYGHNVLIVMGKGEKKDSVPLAPAVHRAIERAVGDRVTGYILLNQWGNKMDGRSVTAALKRLAKVGGVKVARMHPHMLRHTFITTMLDAGVDIRDAQIAARHADPRTTIRYDRARKNLDRHGNYRLAAFMAGST
jgi:integrase/recombinase XerD